jgi:hypothetical protein
MSEPLTTHKVFIPNGKPINVIFFWLLPVVLITLFLLKDGFSLSNFIASVLIFSLLSLEILFYKKIISVIIIKEENTLQYRYYNCWGQKRLVTINLNNAHISYKHTLVNLNYRLFAKLKFRWRILLYEGSYFSNKVIIKEDNEIEYNKQQLDEIFSHLFSNSSVPEL